MGNHSSNSHGNDPTQHARIIENQRDVAIYQDVQGEQFQKYTVLFDGSSTFESSYHFRVNNRHTELVDVLFAASPQSYLGCVQPGSFTVVTQRIPYRLTHFPPQHAQNALTLLQAALKGFKDLFKVHGLMIIKDSMIGVNSKNKVKVWLNANFAVNRPEALPISLQKLQISGHEREIVHNIFDLISSKSQHGAMWRQFTSLFQSKNIHTFETILAVIEDYTRLRKIRLDGYLRNPFNKAGFDKKSENYTLKSEIDKLEDVKLTNLNQINDLELRTAHQKRPEPSQFHELKTNPRHPHFDHISSFNKNQQIKIIRAEPQWRSTQIQPVRQAQRLLFAKSLPKEAIKVLNINTDKITVYPHIQSRRNELIRQVPKLSNTLIRQSHSQSKKLDIKFKYNPKSQVISTIPMTKSINLLGVRINQAAYLNQSAPLPRPIDIQLQPNIPSPRIIQQKLEQTAVNEQAVEIKLIQPVNTTISPELKSNNNGIKVEKQEVKQTDLHNENELIKMQEQFIIQKGIQAKSVLSENNPAVRKPSDIFSNNHYLFETNQAVNSSRQEPSQKGEPKGQIFQQQSYQIKLNQMSRSSIGDYINEQDFNRVNINEQTPFPHDKFNKVKEAVSLPNGESQHIISKESIVIEKGKFQEKQNASTLQSNSRSQKEIIKKQTADSAKFGEQNQPKIVEKQITKSNGTDLGKLPNISYRDIRRMLQQTLERT